MKYTSKIWSILLTAALIAGMLSFQDKAYAKTVKLQNIKSSTSMAVGSCFQIKTNQRKSDITYITNNGKAATVSETGFIYANKTGKTVIKVQSGKSVKKIKLSVINPIGYTISRTSGTYNNAVSTSVKVKKGYKVYYTDGAKFNNKNFIKPGKTKTFKFTETKTLKLYPVKSSAKMTAKKLNLAQKTAGRCADYLFQINARSEDISSDNNALAGENPNITSNPKEDTVELREDLPTSTLPVTEPGDDSASDYIKPEMAEYDETDYLTSAAPGSPLQEIVIPKASPEQKIETETYTISKKNKLTITAPGTYRITTEGDASVDGLIEADYAYASSGTVHIILAGVNLTSSENTAPESDTGLITVKKSVPRAVITLEQDTENTLIDTGKCGIDKEDGSSVTYTGGIVCKRTPLTVNGSGKLNIYTEHGNGMKATGTLKILNAKIYVRGKEYSDDEYNVAGHNGITGRTGLYVKDVLFDVCSKGDGLKTTLDEADIKEDSSLESAGNMCVEGGTYKIISTDGDGVSAYRVIYLKPDVMDIKTMNLSGSTESGSYKGIKAGESISVLSGNINVDTLKTYSSSRAGRDSNDPYADDAIHCDGYIRIDGGSIILAAGDDAMHSDKGLVVNAGMITVTQSYEGLESGDITINGGTIDIISRDDGMNAAGGNDGSGAGGAFSPGGWFADDNFGKGDSAEATEYQIIINDGNITISAEGDGIDSNGNIFMNGGTVAVHGPTGSMNGALDYGERGCVCEISGGTLIAAGAVGMDVSPTSGSSQPSVNVRFSSSQKEGTYVVIKDGTGNEIMTARPLKIFQSVVMSHENMELGETYTVWYGSFPDSLQQEAEFTFTSVSVSAGNASGGGMGPGGGFRPGWQ